MTRRGNWMQTFIGLAFYPLDPRPEEVDIRDIAHALSMLCRYGGHTERFYSVAEHCVLMAWGLERLGCPVDVQLAALLHDATEAYVGDVIRPLKRMLPSYTEAEALVATAIAQRFGLPEELPAVVKEADNRILANERAAPVPAVVRGADGVTRPDWDNYFLGIAAAVATRANCTRRQVGAVLVDAEHRVVSTGYNGAPAGQPGCASDGACPRGRVGCDVVQTRTPYTEGAGKCIAVHAEVNAIIYGGLRQSPAAWPHLSVAEVLGIAKRRRHWHLDSIYVTCEPCPPCYEAIHTVGIGRVLWTPGSD